MHETPVQSVITNLFKGYNSMILAYGQTGSGKTYTMSTLYMGESDSGVIPSAVKEIFEHIRDSFTYDFSGTVSYMELYQEVLYDLLSDKCREQCVLDIREDNRGICIPGLTEVELYKATTVLETLIKGSKSRATGVTNMNAQSSRSHAIFTLNLNMQRIKKTGAVGTTFKKEVNINMNAQSSRSQAIGMFKTRLHHKTSKEVVLLQKGAVSFHLAEDLHRWNNVVVGAIPIVILGKILIT